MTQASPLQFRLSVAHGEIFNTIVISNEAEKSQIHRQARNNKANYFCLSQIAVTFFPRAVNSAISSAASPGFSKPNIK